MESTGGYHLPLYNFLLNHGKKALIINPMLIKKFHDAHTLRRTKTDPLDAITIARYAQMYMMSLQEDRMQLDTESKMLARRRAHNAKNMAKAKTILKSDLAIAFPEILKLNVFNHTLLEILFVFGCAKDVLAASDEEMSASLYISKCWKSELITPKTIRNLAETSVGVSHHSFMVCESAKRVMECQQWDKQLTEAHIELEKTLHKELMDIFTSIPGISPVADAQFLSEIPDINKLETYQKVIIYI